MNVQDHQRKFEISDALISEPVMDASSTQHRDWLIVVMYYAAYHLIHRHCANRKNAVHPKGHGQTISEARVVKGSKKVHPEIRVLYNAAWDARYESKIFSEEDIKEYKKSYNTIKNILA